MRKYGRRISTSEYDQQIVALYRDSGPTSTPGNEAQLRRRELEITIDHRLGVDFPEERREQLWQAQQRVEQSRLRLAYAIFLPRHFRSGRLSRALLSAYSGVLTPEEFSDFFEDDPN